MLESRNPKDASQTDCCLHQAHSLGRKTDAERNLSAKVNMQADVKLFNLKITKVYLKKMVLRKCSPKCRIWKKTLYYMSKCTSKGSLGEQKKKKSLRLGACQKRAESAQVETTLPPEGAASFREELISEQAFEFGSVCVFTVVTKSTEGRHSYVGL